MEAPIPSAQEHKSQGAESESPQMEVHGAAGLQFKDNRVEAVAQRKLQAGLSNSAQVQQLKAIQTMASNSPQVQAAAQLQTAASGHAVQLKSENSVAQLAKDTGSSYEATSKGHVREMEEPHRVLGNYAKGDMIEILSDETSNFKKRRFFSRSKDHVHGRVNGVEGWIVEGNLAEDPTVEDLTVEDSTIEEAGGAALMGANGEVVWIAADGRRIAIDAIGETAYNEDREEIGAVQYEVDDDVLKIGGINADVDYPGLGSVMLLNLVERFQGRIATVEISNVVGSHGYWKKLGFEIPDDLVFDTDDMTPAEIRAKSEKVGKQRALQGISAGSPEQSVGRTLASLRAIVEDKDWNRS